MIKRISYEVRGDGTVLIPGFHPELLEVLRGHDWARLERGRGWHIPTTEVGWLATILLDTCRIELVRVASQPASSGVTLYSPSPECWQCGFPYPRKTVVVTGQRCMKCGQPLYLAKVCTQGPHEHERVPWLEDGPIPPVEPIPPRAESIAFIKIALEAMASRDRTILEPKPWRRKGRR